MAEIFKQKPWGTVCCGDSGPAYAVENIRVDPSRCCSVHLHKERHNQFIILAGTLVVLSWPQANGLTVSGGNFNPDEAYEAAKIEAIKGGDGQRCSVFIPAGIPHQFISISAVQAIEISTPARGGCLNSQDIERFTDGGEVHYKAMERIANFL